MWYNNFLYEVPHELPNDLRIRKLRNIWITQNWVGTQPSSQIDLKKCIFGNNNRKSRYQSFLLLSRFARFFTFGQILLPDLNVKAVWAVQRNCVINVNMVVPFQEVCKNFYDEGSLQNVWFLRIYLLLSFDPNYRCGFLSDNAQQLKLRGEKNLSKPNLTKQIYF